MNQIFRRLSESVSRAVGRPWAFVLAAGFIIVWGLTGPLFGFSEQWQLVVNSFTTIVTFLVVFLIQNTQNRDFDTIQIKLDSLLKSAEGPAHPHINLETLSDEEIEGLERQVESFRADHPKRGSK